MNIKTKAEWTNLDGGVDNWLPELKKLLLEANKAAKGDDFQACLDAAAYLNGFIQESFPPTKEITELDNLAAQTAKDLMNQIIEDRLAAISARTADYLKLEKTFNANAEANNAKADAIRLKGFQTLIDSATQTITSAKEVLDKLDDSDTDEKKLAGLIDKTVDAVEKLRSSVAGLI